MNQKVSKIADEIEKIKAKIISLQNKLKDLEQQKIGAENADIIANVRSINITPDEFNEFLQLFKNQKNNTAVPNMNYSNREEDSLIEE